MKQVTLFLVILIAAVGCKTNIPPLQQTTMKDSTKVEVRYEKVVEIDTCYIEIDADQQTNITDGWYSHLENEYSTSTVQFDSMGLMHHELELKAQSKPIELPRIIERKDSIIYKDRDVLVKEPIYIEKELTWAEQSQIYGFRILLALFVLATIIKKRKTLLALIRRLTP